MADQALSRLLRGQVDVADPSTRQRGQPDGEFRVADGFGAGQRVRAADRLGPFVAADGETGAWREHWLAVEERDGHPVRVGAVTSRPDEWLGAVAGGCVALAPASAARFYSHPGVVFRPVRGIPPSRVALAWPRRQTPTPALDELLAAVARRVSGS